MSCYTSLFPGEEKIVTFSMFDISLHEFHLIGLKLVGKFLTVLKVGPKVILKLMELLCRVRKHC